MEKYLNINIIKMEMAKAQSFTPKVETPILKAETPISKVEIGLGFVELVDYMPSNLVDAERRIVEAARTSTGSERRNAKLSDADKKLIKYLWHNKHMTPFEMCSVQLLVKCPIFVARQWMRHRTGSFNEFSGRYSIMKDEFYRPTARMQDKINKQMSNADEVSEDIEHDFEEYLESSEKLYSQYEDLVKRGVAKEVARIGLPVSEYTQFMWSLNLRNLMHFLELRIAPDAQPEIRDFANAIYTLIKPIFPITCEAFEESLDTISFSAREAAFISKHYAITALDAEPESMSLNRSIQIKLAKLFNTA
jgi:thymidylate synthase (FAD)